MQNEMTREIPHDEWTEFFDRFGQQHHEWLITIEVLDAALGAQTVAENLPLQGISADLKGNGNDVILINAGESLNHSITNPTRVYLKSNAQGAHEAVEFETQSGTTTLLRFRVSAMPETVDGVLFQRE
jgi:hypothetical protein